MSYFKKSNCSIRALCKRVRHWLKMIPALEKRRSTEAELQGTEHNCNAKRKGLSFLSIQNFKGLMSIVG